MAGEQLLCAVHADAQIQWVQSKIRGRDVRVRKEEHGELTAFDHDVFMGLRPNGYVGRLFIINKEGERHLVIDRHAAISERAAVLNDRLRQERRRGQEKEEKNPMLHRRLRSKIRRRQRSSMTSNRDPSDFKYYAQGNSAPWALL